MPGPLWPPPPAGRQWRTRRLFMAVVGVERTDVLEKDDLSVGREHGGNDNGNDAGTHDGNARRMRHAQILPGGPHVLTEFGAAEPHDEQTEHADDQEGGQRNMDAHDVQRDGIVQSVADAVRWSRCGCRTRAKAPVRD